MNNDRSPAAIIVDVEATLIASCHTRSKARRKSLAVDKISSVEVLSDTREGRRIAEGGGRERFTILKQPALGPRRKPRTTAEPLSTKPYPSSRRHPRQQCGASGEPQVYCGHQRRGDVPMAQTAPTRGPACQQD